MSVLEIVCIVGWGLSIIGGLLFSMIDDDFICFVLGFLGPAVVLFFMSGWSDMHSELHETFRQPVEVIATRIVDDNFVVDYRDPDTQLVSSEVFTDLKSFLEYQSGKKPFKVYYHSFVNLGEDKNEQKIELK